jgi:hypothetical protein
MARVTGVAGALALVSRVRALAGLWAQAGQDGGAPPPSPSGVAAGTRVVAGVPARLAASWSRSTAREMAWRQLGLRLIFDLRLKVSCQVVRVGPWRRPGP